MTQNSCCVPGCLVTSKDDIPLHCFPNPDTDAVRFQSWISNIGSEVLHFDNDTIRKKKRVCHKHFESKYHYTKGRLCRLATPVLLMPAMQSLMPGEAVVTDEQLPSTSAVSQNEQLQIIDQQFPSTSADSQTRQVHMTTKYITPKKRGPASTLPAKQQKELSKMMKRIRKCENDKLSFKRKYIEAKKICKTSAFNMLSKNMSNATKIFCGMQFTQSGKKAKGRRFTLDEKILALSIYKPSPKAYRLLSNICTLPSRRTLQNLLHKINVKPGINDIVFENLKKRVSKMPETHKYCTIVFDEMAIGPSLSYDKKNDSIIGLIDNGINKTTEFCDHVLVFMVRGVIKKYKQPVVYSYCSGSTKTPELKRQIKITIEKIQQTGLKVIATVCDQGASNVAAINQLLAETKETYLKAGQEYTGGFFNISKGKIFPIYDPPHLIKGIRNNLLTKNLCYKMNEKNCIAKWSHIEALYNRSPGYKGIKLVPKLTAQHVVPALIPRMRVKHCTQVLSKSVGVALGFMAECGALPKDSVDTADLLIFFDELFDSVNGSFSEVQKGKIYRAALTPTSPHHRLWNTSIPILKSMKFKGSNNQGVVPSLSSWVKTIEGFRLIFKYLNSKGISSLLLRNFNQDALENFFGAIRAHGYSNIMPTSLAFEGAYKTLLINNISSSHSIGSNCEKDDSVCLQSLKYFLNEDEKCVKENHVIEENHLLIDLIDTQELLEGQSSMHSERTAAIGYCSGWIAQLAKKNVFKNCSTCRTDLETDVEQSFHKFIKLKEYSDKKWLCYPSRSLFDFFAHVEQITIEVLKTHCNKNSISEYIKLITSTNLNLNFLSCSHHKEILLHYLINKSIKFFIHNWCKDVNNVITGKITFWDIDDPMKNLANKHFVKNKGRKRKRQNNILLNV